MKEEERIDWNGVKMQLFRIFQQEQFIFKVVGEGSEKHKSEAYHAGTRNPKALLKRFLFTLNSGSISDKMKMKSFITEKTHCVMYLHVGSKIQGFMHLKEYTELSEVTKLLGIDTKHTYFEACEVRGRTEDIIKGTVNVKLGVEGNKQAKWGPCATWAEACKSVGNDMNNILGASYDRTKNILHKKTSTGEKTTAGWLYMEKSLATTATERLAESEKAFSSIPEEGKEGRKKSREVLEALGIYDPNLGEDWIWKHKWTVIEKAIQSDSSNIIGTVNGAKISESLLVKLLKVQLGNTGLRESDRKKLAVLIETKAGKQQAHKPLFYTYDDKPSFNLISGIMQAREDIWQKNSIIKLQKSVDQITKSGLPTPGQPDAAVIKLQKEVKQIKQQVKSLNVEKSPTKEEGSN